jgi:hypothetical protein
MSRISSQGAQTCKLPNIAKGIFFSAFYMAQKPEKPAFA